MFFLFALALVTVAGWLANRGNEKDRRQYDADPDSLRLLALHARQDLKLIAFLLAAAILMLGVVAERMH